ncbi:MAG: GNAT family protein [Anaerolineales bacterium]|jgi:RimJ/RimL family protein N-acetyltransferase|nr:GNAT family protein [Anaerolineales bacterium]
MDITTSLYTGKLIRLTQIEYTRDPETLAEWSQEAGLMRMLDEPPARPLASEQIKKRLEKIEKDMDDKNDLFYFHIRPLDEECLVGWGKIYWIVWPSQIANIELAIGPSQENQGYGSDAFRLLLRLAFDELNLNRLTVRLPEYNLRGIDFVKKFGFREEVRRREVIFRDGRRWDSLHLGLLRAEWSVNHE